MDDKTGTITFHLRHPDPDFLAKLAMPPGAACPPKLPRHDSGRHPLPATGPYMITHYDIRHDVLERNPYFHEWSPDAQPDGYPDRIVWRVYKKTSQAVSAVEHGTADWLYFTIPSITTQQIHEIETNYAAQTHPSAYPATDLLVIATELAVESRSPRAAGDRIRHRPRQARQHPERRQQQPPSAIDVPADPAQLPRVSTLLPVQARPCTRPEARTPLAKLRQTGLGLLLRQGPNSGRYVVELLNSLGFRARLVPADENGEPTEDAGYRSLYSWVADYVGASDFILRIRPGLITPSDLTDARAKQSESQYQGTRAWAAADQRVTDFALIIPIGTGSTLGFTSKRVGNYQFAPAPGNSPIIDQMWVR